MEASTSSLTSATIPSKRISYVLPKPDQKPPRLVLPEVGTGRHPSRAGKKGSANPYIVHHPQQLSPPSANHDPPHGSHPRHSLPVTGLAVDPSTSILDTNGDQPPVPKGLLYTAGRDGLVASWQLGLKMRKRRRVSTSSNRSHRLAEDDEDDDDDEQWIFSEHANDYDRNTGTGTGTHTPDDWEALPFERQWQVDPDWTRSQGPLAKPNTQFRSCVQSHTDWINDMLLCNSNQTVVTASSDRFVRLWSPHDPSTALAPAVLGSHTDYVKALAYPSFSSHSPHWIASGGLDRSIRLWDVGELRRDPIVELCDDASIYCINTDARGGLLAAGTPDSAIRLYDPRSTSKSGPIGRLLGHTDMVRSLVLSKSGRKMLSASSDGTVRLWDVGEQRLVHTFSYHSASVTALYSNSDDLDVFYSGDRDGYVCKVDGEDCLEPDDGECVVLAHSSGPIDKLVALDDSFVWTAGHGSHVECWRDVPRRLERQDLYPIQHDEYVPDFSGYSLPEATESPDPSTNLARREWTRFSIDSLRSDSPSTPGHRTATGDDASKLRLQSALKSGSSFSMMQQQQHQSTSAGPAPLPSSATPAATSPSAMTPHVSFSLGQPASSPQRHASYESEAKPAELPPLAPDVNPAATLFGIPFDSLVSLGADDDAFGATTGVSTGGVGTGLGSMASVRGSSLHLSPSGRRLDGRRGSSFSLRRQSLAMDSFGGPQNVPPAIARLVQLRISSRQAQMRQQQQREMLQRQQSYHREEQAVVSEADEDEVVDAQSLRVRGTRHQSTRSASSIRFAPEAQSPPSNAAPSSIRSPSRYGDRGDDDKDDQVTRSRIAYEERDLALKAKPFTKRPCEIIAGVKGLIRSSVLNDRRHVLTFSSSSDGLRTISDKQGSNASATGSSSEGDDGPEIALWDIVRGICVGHFDTEEVLASSQFGDTPGDLLEKVKERIEGQGAGAAWCSVDTNCGSLTIHLEFPSAFDTEVYLDECDWVSGEDYPRGDQRANLGKWVLRWLFAGFIEKELGLRQNGTADALAPGQLAMESKEARKQRPFALRLPTNSLTDTPMQSPVTAGNTIALAMAPKTPAVGPVNTPLLTPSLDSTFPTIASLTEAVGTASLDSTKDAGSASNSYDYFSSKASNAAKSPAKEVTTPGTPGGSAINAKTPPPVSSPGGSNLIGRLGSRFTRSNTNKNSAGTGAAKDDKKTLEAPKTPGGSLARDAADDAAMTASTEAGRPTDPPSVSQARTVLSRAVTPLPAAEGPELAFHPNTAITICCHSSDAAPWETIYRGLKSSTANDVAVLELASPAWLLEAVLNNRVSVPNERSSVTKITFTLTPIDMGTTTTTTNSEGNSSSSEDEMTLPPLPEGDARLLATRWLRIGKVSTFVCEKLGYVRVSKSRQASIAALSRRTSADVNASTGSSGHASPSRQSSSTGLNMSALAQDGQEALAPGDIELLCNGSVLDADVTLAQVARYQNRGFSSNPLKLEYRRKKGQQGATAAVQWTEGYGDRGVGTNGLSLQANM